MACCPAYCASPALIVLIQPLRPVRKWVVVPSSKMRQGFVLVPILSYRPFYLVDSVLIDAAYKFVLRILPGSAPIVNLASRAFDDKAASEVNIEKARTSARFVYIHAK